MNRRSFILAALIAPTVLLTKKKKRRQYYCKPGRYLQLPKIASLQGQCGGRKINMKFYHAGVIRK